MNTQARSTGNILTQQYEQIQRQSSLLEVAAAELSYRTADMMDRALTVAERDRNLALQLFAERRLAELNHAIEWHENGQRGLCEDCGQSIDPERLEAVPEATLCKPCKEKKERNRWRSTLWK